ncbi:hypothetical protein XENOCAPTIV_002034 [Xenoophorus captivus]|uniref:Uncharacterized protein n=1 Tax=Xenoophorus captivus TaxID=1517983 RepID=A0ABV0REZ0_9TELE
MSTKGAKEEVLSMHRCRQPEVFSDLLDGAQMKRNKLKRNKTTLSKEGPHHVETAVIVVPDRQENPSAADSEEKKSSLCRGFKIAPIFSPTTQHRKHEGSSDAESDRPEHKSMPSSQSGDVKSPRTGSHLTGKRGAVVSSWRLSSNVESCLEEIQKSNPAFPVPTVFSTLLKKASEVQQESGPAGEILQLYLPDCMYSSGINKGPDSIHLLPFQSGHCFHPESSQTHLKEKSRRGLVSERLPKRPKSDLAAEAVVGHCLQSGQDEKKQPRRTKLSCSQQSWSPVGLGNSCPANLGWMNHNTPDTELTKASDQVQGDSSIEDVLWTDKYVPRHSSEVIGNFASVNKLHRKIFKSFCVDLWDCGDFQGEAGLEDRGKEPLGKAMLLTGPSARNLSSSGRKFKAKPASVTLAHYFKMKGKADRLDVSYTSTAGKPETEEVENSSAGCDQTVPKSKKTATSLIVFEEVDVVFEDEVGFLTAIKAFMATTKRPLGSWSETDMLKFLSMSWRRGVPLLYSNLELLLSTGAPESDSQLQTEPRRPGADVHILRLNHTIGSEVSQSRFKSSRLSRRRCTASASDARSASDLPKKTQRASSFNETQSKAQSSCDKPEEHAAKTVANSLDGLADFFDLMSNIDAMLPHHISGPHTAEAFVWTGAAIKDGLLDELAEEDGKSRNQDGLQEIRAAAEGLGCRRCWRRVTEAWTEAHKYKQKLNVKQWNSLQERLLLTTCFKRQNLSFTAQPPCAPR